MRVAVVGGGLAGSEAAWQLAGRGFEVVLYEMRPLKMTPAHRSGALAELVCSNSLGSAEVVSASGLLKEELRRLGSLVISCAERARVPAGKALAVDRELMSREVESRLLSLPNVLLVREEVTSLPDGLAVVATGPLTSEAMMRSLGEAIGGGFLYFFDAVAPVVLAESVDLGSAFRGGRYGHDEDYLNCPLTREEYEAFVGELVRAERHIPHDFERAVFFEGCLPVEEMARRGIDTLRFGPMKPVGLVDPRTGEEPYAVVQLRQENVEGTLLGMVGFQTSLRWGEQDRIFRMIPALRNAEFVRYGVMHRNAYVNAPVVLDGCLRLKRAPNVFLAGQLVGVEGYVESVAMGLVAALNLASTAMGRDCPIFPRETMVGSLLHYLSTGNPRDFKPMNANFGLMPPLGRRIRDRAARNAAMAGRALSALESFVRANPHLF